MKKLFIDCDILLDVFLDRDPFVKDSKKILNLIELKKVKGFTSGLVLANLHFILSKMLNKKDALNLIRKLNLLINISDIKQSTIDKALSSSFVDFEDSIQNYSALETSVDYLITRNIKDYKTSNLKVITPKEFIKIYETNQSLKFT